MKITVETIVRAHIAKVWSAYTTPADIKQWNTASDDWHTTQSTVDLREGGAFSSRMEAKDGSFGFDFAGTYTKIVPQQRIEYAFGDRTGTVEFLVGANNVTVRSTFDAETQNPVEQQRQGWQAILNNFAKHVEAGHSIRTCLWFRDGRGREAAEFYCALIPGSRVETTFSADAGHGAFSVIDFTLGGVPYQILDAGPMFTLTEAVSISVATDDQAESDRLWMALTANGGQESHCGWLKDRFGVSWQVYPKRLTELTTSADKNVSAKAMAAMMKQMKINIAEIEAAVREAQ